jgi:uncharacterized membrane protein
MELIRQNPRSVNVGEAERWVSMAAGGTLALYGLARRSLGGWALALLGGSLVYRGVTGRCGLYGALGVSTSDADRSAPYKRAIKVEKAVTVNRPPDELYRFWRSFENLPRFMGHLESVQALGGKRSHWVANGPAGMRVEWEAEIINEVENDLIAWQSRENADVYNSGSVHFRRAPGGRGTEVEVVIRYTPPAGALGVTFAKLFGEEPSQQVEEDLRRFKHLMEAGEIPTIAGQPAGGSPLAAG